MPKTITEEMKEQDKWYKEAKSMTMAELPKFLSKLTEDYNHDYGTICHAISAAAIGAAWSVERTPQGGITGFQAGAVMWEFLRQWSFSSNKAGLKIVDYDKFLYPQYSDYFDKTITNGAWGAIQKEAKANIAKSDIEYKNYLELKAKYQQDVAAFIEKHPDYLSNKKYYDHLGMGTGDEWDAEEKKKESGFEFAPQEPSEPVRKTSRVYMHWQSIVNGRVPFGFTVED